MVTPASFFQNCAIATLALIAVSLAETSTAAVYKLTFTGTFNDDDVEGSIHNRASFTELIGATHTAGNPLWQPGGHATAGIEDVAEQGDTTALEIEINNHISAGTAASMFITGYLDTFPGSKETVLAVPNTHAYITAISMIAPSPDWFIGVHNLELKNGESWISDLSVDLQPWDAGTEEGNTFSFVNPPSVPQVPIAQITGSPFIGSPVIGTLRFEHITPNGDINENGIIDAGDVLLAMRFLLTHATPTLQELTRADLMPTDTQGTPVPDGQITFPDVLRLMQLLTGP